MSDTTRCQQDVIEKVWKVLNLKADTLLRLSRAQVERGSLRSAVSVSGAALFAAPSGHGVAGYPAPSSEWTKLGCGLDQKWNQDPVICRVLCETEKDDRSAGKAGKIVIAQSPDALTKVRLRDRRDLVRH
jgi:hypothetical protein